MRVHNGKLLVSSEAGKNYRLDLRTGRIEGAMRYITRHEPEKLFVEMLKISPRTTACRLTIQLCEEGAGCIADVTYIRRITFPLSFKPF